jgi:hypothetical protein
LISKGQVSEEAMFLRVVRAAGGKGVKHEYVRVVEASHGSQSRAAGFAGIAPRLEQADALAARRCRA